MKITSKIKWLTAVSIIAIGIPVIAYASPYNHPYTSTNSSMSPKIEHTNLVIPKISDNKQNTNNIHKPVQNTTATPPTKQAVVITPQKTQISQNNGYQNGHTHMNDGYHINRQTGYYHHSYNTGSSQGHHGMGHE